MKNTSNLLNHELLKFFYFEISYKNLVVLLTPASSEVMTSSVYFVVLSCEQLRIGHILCCWRKLEETRPHTVETKSGTQTQDLLVVRRECSLLSHCATNILEPERDQLQRYQS